MIVHLLACTDFDLAQEWELDRLRLLAVRGDPAEPRPGETVTFTSLSYVPDDADWTAVWFACIDGDEAGCTLDPELLEQFGNADTLSEDELLELYAALQAAGFIGYEPGLAPVWVVPDDALGELSDEEALEGVSATVNVTLATEADTEIVIRRVPVSHATTPNHNPDIGSFTIDDIDIGEAFVATAGQSYALEVVLADGLEGYEYLSTEGIVEDRTEEPEYRWYSDTGVLTRAEQTSLDPDPTDRDEVTWTAPEGAREGVIHAVALDGRGGMAWRSVSVRVE